MVHTRIKHRDGQLLQNSMVHTKVRHVNLRKPGCGKKAVFYPNQIPTLSNVAREGQNVTRASNSDFGT